MRRIVWTTLMSIQCLLARSPKRPDPKPALGAILEVQDEITVMRAIDVFNSLVGCQMLEYANSGTIAEVHISETTNRDINAFMGNDPSYGISIAGLTIPTTGGTYVILNENNSEDIVIPTIVHELGHVFGLGHTAGNDIMTAAITDSRGIYFTPAHIERLQAQCPEK